MMIWNAALRAALLAGAALPALATPAPADAQPSAAIEFDLPAQLLGDRLHAIARLSGREIIFASEVVAGRSAPRLRARLTADEAIRASLADSALVAEHRAGAVLILARPPADSPPTEAAEEVVITVTGTRIRGSAPVGSDVIIIDRAEIERSGYATTQEIAQTIPQNFGGGPNEGSGGISLDPNAGKNTGLGSSLNLRGLGNASTLVLLNGDRPPLGGFAGVFSDVSLIPASAVERIEIVADGTSAIYGSDAVAGVVNIIPRLRFDGAETSLRFGTADGDTADVVASQIVGRGWASGRAILAYEFYRRSSLAAADRDFVTDDLRAFGGPDARGPFANPGNILAGGRTFAIPRGQDGTNLSAGQLLPDNVNRGDAWNLVDVLPMQRRHSLFGAVTQELGDAVQLYAQGLYSSRDFSRSSRTISDTPRTVPVSNPFYVDPLGTRQPVRVQYDFGRDLGRERRVGSVEAYGLTLGVRAELGRWSADLRGNVGRQTEESAIVNRVNSARLAVALADTNRATAYNLFGDGPSTNQATIDFVRGSTSTSNRGTVWSATLRADGPLFRLPAGDARIAIGGEYREEHYLDGETISDTSTLAPQVLQPIQLPGPRRIRAFYAEALVPIFGGDFSLPGLRRLDLSAAVRTEEYSDFGSTTNPRLGLNWEPLDGIRLRGTYGTSFRAPSFDNLRQDPGTTLLFAFTVADPASPAGQSNILVERGNDPGLQPEEAKTWSVGVDFEPPFLPAFRANITYFNIDYRGRITSPAANLANFLVNRETYQAIIQDRPSAETVRAFYASPFFINPLGIAPETITALVDARLQNLSVVRQSGLDVELAHSFDMFGGRAEVGASGTYIFNIDQALTPTALLRNVVDILGNPVDLRVRGRANWTSERWSAALFVNYLDSYTNLTNVAPQPVDSWTTFDAQVGYRLPQRRGPLAGLRISLGATNLFDADPPFAAYNLGVSVTGYDPDNASPLGRVISLQVTRTW